MKKSILISLMLFISAGIFAQNEKMIKAIESKLTTIDTSRNAAELIEMANYFDRICKAEDKEWLPLYYKALSLIRVGFTYYTFGKLDLIDAQADEAEKCLDKLDTLIQSNSEIYCLRKMVATMRIVADPYTRFQAYTPVSKAAIEKAKELDPDNPRIYLLLGLDKYNTPEQFGGSKTEAKALFETAITKFNVFKPALQAGPQWGLPQARYFYSQCK
jgi:hypothetical protein